MPDPPSFTTKRRSIASDGTLSWGDSETSWRDSVAQSDRVSFDTGNPRPFGDVPDDGSIESFERDTLQYYSCTACLNAGGTTGGEPRFRIRKVKNGETVLSDTFKPPNVSEGVEMHIEIEFADTLTATAWTGDWGNNEWASVAIEDDEFNTGGIAWDTSKGASQTSADFHIDDLHLVQ